MALTLENHAHEVNAMPCQSHWNMDDAIDRIHYHMQQELSERKFKIYKMLFIDGKSDEEVGVEMGYKTSEKNRSAGYKQIRNLKKMFKETVQKIIQKNDIIIHG